MTKPLGSCTTRLFKLRLTQEESVSCVAVRGLGYLFAHSSPCRSDSFQLSIARFNHIADVTLVDNQEDGEYSCTNNRRLKTDLKGVMGFQGLVQSDWGAGHGTTVQQGLDMDMPMSATPDYSPTELRKVDPADIDEAVTRTCELIACCIATVPSCCADVRVVPIRCSLSQKTAIAWLAGLHF